MRNDLEQYFTIKINENIFVPVVQEDDKYYHLLYMPDKFPHRGFTVTKQSYMPSIKQMITNEIYIELKQKGML